MPRKAPTPTTGTILSLEEAERLRAENGHASVNISWGGEERPWNEPQIRILTSTADEILAAGGKGGGKSEAARAWLISGNPHLPSYDDQGERIPWNESYAYHPEYHGLILRKNEDDLKEFVNKASVMYRPLGGEYVSGQFRFPSGAIIDCGHMKDRTAWTKYLGIQYVRIVIDEAALIPDFESYEQLRSCLRTVHPELRTQVLLTSNANGPGVAWLTERFMDVRDKSGEKYPAGTLIEEEYEDPDTGEKFTQTRIWIFSTYRDNPAVMKTKYGRQLQTIRDEKMRRAYLDGDWYALFGSYFGDIFRSRGPRQGEPPNANHVLPANGVKLQPWYHISSAMDWGLAHESAFGAARQTPDRRIIVYREIVASGVMPVKFGHEIGMAMREDLEKLPSHSMVLHLSHDAFDNRTGDKSIAELIAMGIQRVLGPDAVHLPDLMIRRIKDSFALEADNWAVQDQRDKAIEQIRLQRRIGITIRKAEKTGIIGWQHCREAMRWEPVGELNAQFQHEVFMRLLQQDPKQADEYAKLYRDLKPEVLPRLQILDCCPRLIDAIPKAQHEEGTENIDKAHFKGKDSIDFLSYLITGLLEEIPPEPFESVRTRALDDAVRREPNISTDDLVRINMGLEAEWKKKNTSPAPYTPPRSARMSRLIMQGKWKPQSNIYERV